MESDFSYSMTVNALLPVTNNPDWPLIGGWCMNLSKEIGVGETNVLGPLTSLTNGLKDGFVLGHVLGAELG